MAILKGKNLMVSIGGTIYGFATSCSLKKSRDTKEIAAYKHSGGEAGWKEYDVDKQGWEITSEYLATVDLADFKALDTAMNAGTSVAVSFMQISAQAGSTYVGETIKDTALTTSKLTKGIEFKGNAYITSLDISAQEGNDVTYSITLQGTGALTCVASA